MSEPAADRIGPGWQARRFLCLKCQHAWQGWIPTHIAVAVWIAAVKALRCPKCGASTRRITFDLAREREEGAP